MLFKIKALIAYLRLKCMGLRWALQDLFKL